MTSSAARRAPAMPTRETMLPVSVGRLTRRLLIASFTMLASFSGAASAQAAGPVLTVTITHSPATFQRGDIGDGYTVNLTNTGDAPTSGTITLTETLPAAVKVRSVNTGAYNCPSTADLIAGAPFVCTSDESIAPGDSLPPLVLDRVATASDAPNTVINTVAISGGGAPDTTFTDTAPVVDRPVFNVTDFTARALDLLGNDYTVAGGHPESATSTFSFASYPFGPVNAYPVEDVKDIFADLPPGFVGNASGLPRCQLVRFTPNPFPTCPPASEIGNMSLGTVGQPGISFPIYNVVPERGYPAEFAFKFANNAVVMYPKLRPRTGQYGVTVAVPGAARVSITSVALTFYGVPSAHNGVGGPAVPFLANPADCLVAQPVSKLAVDSWQNPARQLDDGFPDLTDTRWKTATATAPPVVGCDAPSLVLQFAPAIKVGPVSGTGSSAADTPSGYKVDLTFPQTNDLTDPTTVFDPAAPAAPPLKDVTVTLPSGVAISPSAADGLAGCSDVPGADDQVRLGNTLPVTCPEASKIGAVVATTPLLAAHDPDTDAVTGAEPINGDVYLIKPHPGDLDPAGNQNGQFRVLIQLNSERYGLNVKLPGVVVANRSTGQLTATFTDNPQLPVKNLELTFKTGDRSPLVNPITCGAARTSATFTPWSRSGTRSDGLVVLGTPDVTAGSTFNVSWDGRGAACPAKLPFAPSMDIGLVNRNAGGSSTFAFDLSVRKDREDFATGLSVTLPGGLLAAVKNVPLCTNEQANGGTCPAASRVGSATVAAGAGDHPFYLANQPVWLTGPYNGGPYGLAIAVHAKAGPFDLGNVIVRQALKIDLNDTHVTVVSDPLPTIRDGVPLRVRKIHVDIDRPGFMRAPTSCDQKAITATVTSQGGASVNLSSPFSVTGCDKLPFAPRLLTKLTNSTQTKVGGHPGLDALVTQKPGEAALQSATVTLPLALALDPDNAVSDSLCEFADGLKDQCPEKSVIGSVTATSPLLKTPLTGKVYFVKNVRLSPTGRFISTLPTLLVALRGEINVDLRAQTSVPDNKHLVTTFPLIPDAAISSFNLKLNGGKKGILVVTDGHDTCKEDMEPFFAGAGQNGKRVDHATTMLVDCPLALSRTFTSTSVKVKVSGIGAGTVTVSGAGVKTTKRTIASATSATITAKLTAQGRQLRRQGKDVRVKVSFLPKGTKKAKVAYSTASKAKNSTKR